MSRLQEFAEYGQGIFVRFAVLLLLLSTITLVLEKKYRLFSKFLNTPAPALDLGIYRVVTFSLLFSAINFTQILDMAALPASMRTLPLGFAQIAKFVPITPAFAQAASLLFVLTCFAAILGIGTRISTKVAVLSGIYLLGIRYSFGKVDHAFHLVVWSGLVLSFAPCGDAVSFDAFRRAWKNADSGHTSPPEPALAYGIPLRMCMLLIGVAYLYPGFWKFVQGGFEWFAPTNFKTLVYHKWTMDGQSAHAPLWAIAFDPVVSLGSIGAVLFELSFIYLMLFDKMRLPMCLVGQSFHFANWMLLRISFLSMQLMYVCFVPWSRFFQWLGRRLFPQQLVVLYDGDCGICRRTVASLRAGDFLQRVIFVASTDIPAMQERQLEGYLHNGYLENFIAMSGQKNYVGYDAYRVLIPRIFLFAPLTLLFFMPFAGVIGRRIYARVANSRTCTIEEGRAAAKFRHISLAPFPLSSRGVWGVGLVLLGLNSLLGLAKVEMGWPLACFPTFGKTNKGVSLLVVAQVKHKDGSRQQFDMSNNLVMLAKLGNNWDHRLNKLIAYKSEHPPDTEVKALWNLFVQTKSLNIDTDDVVELLVRRQQIDFHTFKVGSQQDFPFALFNIRSGRVELQPKRKFD